MKKHRDITEDELSDEQLAGALTEDSEPFGRLKAVAQECGISGRRLQELLKRARDQYGPVVNELKSVKVSELLDLLEDRAYRALAHLDDESFAEASAKDKAIIAGIMLEKRQLLRGEPTQILSIEERRSLNDLLPDLIAEAERRGLSVDHFGDSPSVKRVDVDKAVRPTRRMPVQDLRLDSHRRAKEESGEP